MADEDEIREQVMGELEEMRKQIAGLEVTEAKRKKAEECWAEVMALLVDSIGTRKE